MDGKQTGNMAKNETPKAHFIDLYSVAIVPKEGWQRMFVEKLVQFGNEKCDYCQKYTRLEKFTAAHVQNCVNLLTKISLTFRLLGK
jgi:hypothetical protein